MKRALFAIMLMLPAPAAADTVRIWGPPAMRGIVERWADAYHRAHPGTDFEIVMRGSDTAIPGLYGGQADIALMGRENDGVDDNGFSRTMQRKFVRIALTSGSLAVPGKSDAPAFLVHAGNPVTNLTFAQIAGTFDCDAQRRGPRIRTWGDLGAKGVWAKAPIRIHAYDFATKTGVFFQHVAMRDARKMCWDRISEYDDAHALDGTSQTAASRIGTAAREDKFALALANTGEAHGGLKAVAVNGVLPTTTSVIAGTYPFVRRTYAFFDRAPGAPLKPAAAAFLRFALSEEGQAMLAADNGYLPLDPVTVAASRATLDTR